MSVLRAVRKRKKVRKLGSVNIIRREAYADLELDAKVELIRSLVPLGLMHVQELLDEEVTAVKGGTKLDQMAEENQTTWPLGRVSENGCAKGGVRMVERQRRGGRACCVRDDSCRRSAPGCGRDESADRAARQSAVRSRRSRSIR